MTSRTNKKHFITRQQQDVLTLEKELEKLRHAQYNLGYMVLDKPLRDGWIRTFKLRSDLERNKHAKVYREVINSIVIKIWGREKKYADKSWERAFKEANRNIQRPGIKYLNEKEFDKLSLKAKKHFHFTFRRMYHKYEKVFFCTLPKYYFTTTYERAYITSRNIISPEIERRIQEINEILSKPEYFKHSIYHSGRYRSALSPHKRLRRKTNMALNEFDFDRLEELRNRNVRRF